MQDLAKEIRDALDLFDKNDYKNSLPLLQTFSFDPIVCISLLYYYDVLNDIYIFKLDIPRYELLDLIFISRDFLEEFNSARELRWRAWYYKYYNINPKISIHEENEYWKMLALRAIENGDVWSHRLFLDVESALDADYHMEIGCNENDDACLYREYQYTSSLELLERSANLKNVRAMHSLSMKHVNDESVDVYISLLKKEADVGIKQSFRILSVLYKTFEDHVSSVCYNLRMKSPVYCDTDTYAACVNKLRTVVNDVANECRKSNDVDYLKQKIPYALISEIEQGIELASESAVIIQDAWKKWWYSCGENGILRSAEGSFKTYNEYYMKKTGHSLIIE